MNIFKIQIQYPLHDITNIIVGALVNSLGLLGRGHRVKPTDHPLLNNGYNNSL
jgi:hypothetical protein